MKPRVPSKEEVDELAAIRELEARLAVLNWQFVGPCPHGHDPYTRCDSCGELSPINAAVWAARQKERERCEKIAEGFDCSDTRPCCRCAPEIADLIRKGEP